MDLGRGSELLLEENEGFRAVFQLLAREPERWRRIKAGVCRVVRGVGRGGRGDYGHRRRVSPAAAARAVPRRFDPISFLSLHEMSTPAIGREREGGGGKRKI